MKIRRFFGKDMREALKQVKDELGDAVSIIKIDVDKNKALASKFQVRGVPTFVLFKNGKQVWKQAGMLSKADLKQRILSL